MKKEFTDKKAGKVEIRSYCHYPICKRNNANSNLNLNDDCANYTEKNICLKLPNSLETHDKILKQRTFF